MFVCVSARHVKMLSHREQYGFHGFYFLLVFIYKYIIDTSFILVSCTNVNQKQVRKIIPNFFFPVCVCVLVYNLDNCGTRVTLKKKVSVLESNLLGF